MPLWLCLLYLVQRFAQSLENDTSNLLLRIRLVLDLESRAQISKEHFELLNRLPVNSRGDHFTLCHDFKMKNGLSPQYMRENVITQYGVHTYNTGLSSKGAFVIPKVISHGHKSFCYNGCSLWNSLPHTFSEITNLSHFKGCVKATSVEQFLTIYSAMYQCLLSTVIYLFACYTPIYYS